MNTLLSHHVYEMFNKRGSEPKLIGELPLSWLQRPTFSTKFIPSYWPPFANEDHCTTLKLYSSK